MTKDFDEKVKKLQNNLLQYTKQNSMVAFSGGVDSSLLLKLACDAAKENGKTVYAITAHTKLHPLEDIEVAQRVGKELGAIPNIISIDELMEAGIAENPPERCYFCKKCIFGRIKQKAEALGVATILEGTNADDLLQYRPGIQAVQELGIKSPLADAELTKDEVRKLAARYGLSTATRPATPCLATRFPYYTILSYEKIQKVAEGEAFLKKMGFYNIRLRAHEAIARIEVDSGEFQTALENKKEIVQFIKQLGFSYVTLDLEGFRSGSMDLDGIIKNS